MRIVRYWQEGLWQTIYNQQPLPKSLVETAWQCERAEVDEGVLQTAFPVDKETAVWVAPLVFYKSHPQPEYWVPLWLPALAEKNHLALRKDNSLPWVPASQFDTCQNGPFQGERGAVDDWLRYECLNEDNQFIWENWSDCVKACIDALDIFSEQPWQEVLIERGFEVMQQSMIWTEAALLGPLMNENDLSPLLKQFCEIEEVEKSAEERSLPISALLCGSAKKELAQSTYEMVRTLLSLQDEALITLRTPIGCDKVGCLSTIIASKIVKQTIHEQTFPKIALLTSDTDFATALLQTLKPASEAVSMAQLKQAYADYQKGLKLFNEAQVVAEIERELVELQLQDESLEKVLLGYFKKQDQLKPRSRLAQFFKKFNRDKQKAAQALMLSEKIRKCKTKRTNIHRKIVNVVETINQNRQSEKEWQAWLQCYLPGVAADIQSVQLAYSSQLLSSTLAYWQQQSTKEWLLFNPHCEGSIDLLLIDEAQKRLPQQVAPYLAKAKQALFLGDNHADESTPAISQLAEERALAKHQLDDEETIEQMHYKGMLLGTGNALTVALANTKVPMNALDAGFYHPQIAGFLKEAALSSTQSFTEEEGLHFLNITGSTEKRGHQLLNELEAHTIVNWVINGPFANKQHLVQIFTPFTAQQDFLKQQLQLAGVQCAVYDFAHLPNQVGDYAVFSPVHTNACRRPFIFDRGEHHFYRMMARARRAFWIVGDKRIFDPKMHSPSGQLAKCLFAKVHPLEKTVERIDA